MVMASSAAEILDKIRQVLDGFGSSTVKLAQIKWIVENE